VMGERRAATVVAAVHSAGGYIRGLTEKARAGQFSPGPMLMALIGNRKRAANEQTPA
jgi:replication initiation protein RepC